MCVSRGVCVQGMFRVCVCPGSVCVQGVCVQEECVPREGCVSMGYVCVEGVYTPQTQIYTL